MGSLQGQVWAGQVHDSSVEATDKLVSRVLGWWDSEIISIATGFDDQTGGTTNVLVVTHGAVMAHLISALGVIRGYNIIKAVQSTDHIVLNASISVVEVKHDGCGALIKYADASHLQAEELVKLNVDEIDSVAPSA